MARLTVYVTPSTAFQFVMSGESLAIDPKPPGFRVIDIDDSGFTTEVLRLDAHSL